jgi:lyso-ornithine lipid O-acyltransferase
MAFQKAAEKRSGQARRMTTLRALGILTIFAIVTFALLPLQWLAIKLRLPLRRSLPHWYHRFVCRLFGIRISVLGEPAGGGVLIAANHTGWMDIPILSAVWPVSFVSKLEVNSWPFFGTLARMQRSVFVRRERTKSLANRESIRERLIEGDALVIFPEGTSSDGNRVLPFRSGLLSAAEVALDKTDATAPVAVQPVSVAYTAVHGIPMGRENRPFFAWYGDMELASHFWEALKTGPIDVVVEFHPVLALEKAGGRKELARRCEDAVRGGLIRALSGKREAAPAVAAVEEAHHSISQTETEIAA